MNCCPFNYAFLKKNCAVTMIFLTDYRTVTRTLENDAVRYLLANTMFSPINFLLLIRFN